eukprot:scaffold447_cov307-Pinguiococcus_pyrenoidosus.AAC.65
MDKRNSSFLRFDSFWVSLACAATLGPLLEPTAGADVRHRRSLSQQLSYQTRLRMPATTVNTVNAEALLCLPFVSPRLVASSDHLSLSAPIFCSCQKL